MKITSEKIICEKYNKEFKVVIFNFNYLADFKQIEDFIKEGTDLAQNLNPVLARDSMRARKYKTVLTNAIAGVISEWVWRYWLNKTAIEMKKAIIFEKTRVEDIKNQIDIKLILPNKSFKSIEVRSSFPYTGIKNGICKAFDIIGWYANTVKVRELKKDYYLRCLFPYKVEEFNQLLKKDFNVYLTGGATRELLENSKDAKDKKFIPLDEINEENIKTTAYRVIEPIVNALDTDEIQNELLKRE